MQPNPQFWYETNRYLRIRVSQTQLKVSVFLSPIWAEKHLKSWVHLVLHYLTLMILRDGDILGYDTFGYKQQQLIGELVNPIGLPLWPRIHIGNAWNLPPARVVRLVRLARVAPALWCFQCQVSLLWSLLAIDHSYLREVLSKAVLTLEVMVLVDFQFQRSPFSPVKTLPASAPRSSFDLGSESAVCSRSLSLFVATNPSTQWESNKDRRINVVLSSRFSQKQRNTNKTTPKPNPKLFKTPNFNQTHHHVAIHFLQACFSHWGFLLQSPHPLRFITELLDSTHQAILQVLTPSPRFFQRRLGHLGKRPPRWHSVLVWARPFW